MNQLPARLNLAELMTAPAPELDFVLPGFKRGTVGALVSPGGVGKSYWALAVAVSVASGIALGPLAVTQGKVVYLAAEDDIDILHSRLRAIVPEGADLAGFDIRSTLGMAINIMNNQVQLDLASAAKGARLLVLDTLSRFHSLDENSTRDMTSLMIVLEAIAAKSGAALLYLHHSSKLAASQGQSHAQQAARGSSVLVDNARWAAFLAVMTEAEARTYGVSAASRELYVRWNLSKQNYGGARADQWYLRGPHGAMQPIALTGSRKAGKQSEATIAQVEDVAPLPSTHGKFENKW